MQVGNRIKYAVIAAALFVGIVVRAEEPIMDMGAAIDYCSSRALTGPEGIWEFPEDQTRVLITRRKESPYHYDIKVVSSPDCRLQPGEKIGEMEESAKPGKLRISLYASRRKNLLTDMRHCAGDYQARTGRILIEPRSVKLSLRNSMRHALQPLDILPKFWLLFSIKVNDPAAALPTGLIRLYPSSISSPRYL